MSYREELNQEFEELGGIKPEPVQSSIRPLLSKSDFADLGTWFNTTPPDRKYIIEDLIAEDITAVLNAAGGVGKSNLILLMCACVACGLNIAPFKVKRQRKVLLINVEDGESDLWRRIHALGQVYPVISKNQLLLQENLLVYPGRGKVKPFMRLENGRPLLTDDGRWMMDSMVGIQPEFAVFDTKSRLYGLDENSNDHAAQWWQIFEESMATLDNGCTALVSAHSSQAGARSATQFSNRGATAFIDNARLNIVLCDITEDETKLFDIDPDNHFSLTVPKTNYTKKSSKLFFEKTQYEGVPKYSTAIADRFIAGVNRLVELIGLEDGGRILKREIESKTGGKIIRDLLKDEFGFGKQDITKLIAGAFQDGKIKEISEGRKVFIEVVSHAF